MGPDSEEGKGNKNMPGRPLRSPISVLFVPFLRVKTLFHDMREETPMVFLSGDWPFFIFYFFLVSGCPYLGVTRLRHGDAGGTAAGTTVGERSSRTQLCSQGAQAAGSRGRASPRPEEPLELEERILIFTESHPCARYIPGASTNVIPFDPHNKSLRSLSSLFKR